MPPQKHSDLGASKAHQWIPCPPSIEAEKRFGEPDKPSDVKDEGSLAHELAEDHLRKMLNGKKVTTPKKLKDNALYRKAMEEHVGVYCDVIL